MSNTVQRFGQTIELNEMPVTSPYAQSWWSAASRGWDTGWESTKTRWGALFENAPQMSYEEFVAKYGEEVGQAWNPSVNEYNADYLAWEAKTQIHAQQYQGRPVAEFLGAIIPSLPDPVNVATLPVGGARAVAATTSKSASGFLKNSAIGGFQAGAASLPLEVAMQQEVYGELRPEELALSVVAPVALSPVLSAPGFVVSRIRDGKLQRAVDEQMDLPANADREAVAQAFEEAPDVTLPPQAPAPVEPPAPTLRVFDEYGGEAVWAMAAARGDAKAREYAIAHNIDPDSPALRAFFIAESNRQAVTTPDVDVARNAELLLALRESQLGPREVEVPPRPTPEGVSGEIIEAKNGAVFFETRGGTRRFHGTSQPLPESGPRSDHYGPMNIYGQGFYTTDAADIAAGYMRKGRGKAPTLYEVDIRNDVPLYDLDAPLTPDDLEMARRVFRRDMSEVYDLGDDAPRPYKTMREVFDQYRADSRDNFLSADTVQEAFDSIRFNLERRGYRGYRHTGGLGTGNKPHDVRIFWEPQEDIAVRPSDLSTFKPYDEGAPRTQVVEPVEERQALLEAGVVRAREDGGVEVLPPFREVAQLLSGDETGPALRAFIDSGPDRIKAQHQQKLWNDIRDVQQSDLPREAKAKRVEGLTAELEEVTGGARTLKPDFDRDALLDALDAARLESAQPVAALRGHTGDSATPAADPLAPVTPEGMDPATANVREYAQRAGVDLATVDSVVDDVIERMTRCGA